MTANRLPMLAWLFILGWLSAAAGQASAQPPTPAADGTNTVVTPNGNRYDISGGLPVQRGLIFFTVLLSSVSGKVKLLTF